jgi:hypothetical protein
MRRCFDHTSSVDASHAADEFERCKISALCVRLLVTPSGMPPPNGGPILGRLTYKQAFGVQPAGLPSEPGEPAGATEGQEEPCKASPNTEAAVSEVELRAYYDRKRPMALWSVGLAVLLGAAIATKSPIGAVALVFGTGCGLANAFLSMKSNERLAEHRNTAIFVLSSILRIGVFGIVPVEFALHGPWWTMIAYFIGFFTPLALYTVLVARAVRTG